MKEVEKGAARYGRFVVQSWKMQWSVKKGQRLSFLWVNGGQAKPLGGKYASPLWGDGCSETHAGCKG
jgi:hypothetical protein